MITGYEVTARTEQLFPDRIVRRITFLRKPASRIVSAFNYETSDAAPFTRWDETVPFETWYRHQERDVMTKFLGQAGDSQSSGRRVCPRATLGPLSVAPGVGNVGF